MNIHLRRLAYLVGIVVTMIALGGLPAAPQEAFEVVNTLSLTGYTWQWVQFADGEQEIEVPTANYTIVFTDEGNVYVRADCNRARGTYTTEGSTLTISPLATTLAMCPPGSLSNDFLGYLGEATDYSFTGEGHLLLKLRDYSGTLTFRVQPQVTGTVTYPGLMTLPPGSVIRVQIQDMSVSDTSRTSIGEQVITPGDAPMPIPFAVSYPGSAINESHEYSVLARVSDGNGKVIFVSDTNNSIITNNRPTSDIELTLVRTGE